ncbi:cation-translocating P-type ATPase [Rhodobacter ferrooxidans]|uniref:ATPase, P-type (Transporting), HAD superfamily, subfamily IC n=1 Tax=Rhodobacter ferrooxidans TaxID=371731 RepID=C8S0W4_9RHOB|nr:cation-translocating P-type ATPase [Rhodobacter sp. SW2]EEW25405.1 ATPase, P-type (transporting), HAD superfamily, subfamily IC [Rhodobacter sp. SW2]
MVWGLMQDATDDSLPQGLTAAQAQARLASEGANELPRQQRRSGLRIAFDVLREPMLALLLGGGVVYLLLGDRQEALILLAFACLSVGITAVQEARTERVLEALRDLTSPRALVIRDGTRQRIAGREVVRGDLLVLAEGDRVPADARLLQASGVFADESLLTGEAIPVSKLPGQVASPPRPGGNDLPFVFAGTLVVRGSGLAEVTATGARSEIGRIGKSLGMLEVEVPHLQRQMRRLVLVFAATGAAVSLAVVALHGLTRGDWLQAVLAGIAVGMSMLPEEFPMVLAVFMAMAAWRISQARVLTRRASAIETLGAATVLCTDKTGTLTENRMAIARLQRPGSASFAVGDGPMPPDLLNLALMGAAASTPQPFDPMEKAFFALALPDPAMRLIRSYPLSPGQLSMTQVWQDGDQRIAAAKGAPEAMADLCALTPAARAVLADQVQGMADAGLRVLGIASCTLAPGADLPEAQAGFALAFAGLVGLADPLRATVPQAVAECRTAGIRVIMVTGDYPATARAIASAAGLAAGTVITGPELETMSDADLTKAVKTATVFARIMPEQKLRIVQALKAGGAVVAMTGDGVNDAPSLKAAHIGVAMGGRGTDVAREAAAIVLLDDDFGSIVTTVRLGRRIYDNLRKAMRFILAVHVPIAGLALMPLLTGLPILFGPVHIAFLEMIIDPVCSLVFEAEGEEAGVMRRPPRPADQPLFSGQTVLWSLLQGLTVFAAVAAIFWFAPGFGLAADQVRGLTFAALVLGIVALILVNRSASASLVAALIRPNRALFVVLPLVAAMLAVVLLWQPARALLGFGALEPRWLLVPPLAGLGVLLLLEAAKPLLRRAVRRLPG